MFAFVLILPVFARADMTPVAIDGYAIQATKGSEEVLSIKGIDNFDGTIQYNKDELKYVSWGVSLLLLISLIVLLIKNKKKI